MILTATENVSPRSPSTLHHLSQPIPASGTLPSTYIKYILLFVHVIPTWDDGTGATLGGGGGMLGLGYLGYYYTIGLYMFGIMRVPHDFIYNFRMVSNWLDMWNCLNMYGDYNFRRTTITNRTRTHWLHIYPVTQIGNYTSNSHSHSPDNKYTQIYVYEYILLYVCVYANASMPGMYNRWDSTCVLLPDENRFWSSTGKTSMSF